MVYSLHLQRDGCAWAGCIAFTPARLYAELARASAAFLHPAEQRYFAETRSAARRSSFLLGRHAAKQALAGCLSRDDDSAIEIAWGVFGQPLVRYGAAPAPELSIAHTRGAAVAVACAAGHPIGVDIEHTAGPRDLGERDLCAPGERDLVRRMRLPDPAELLLLWTIKEALAKVLRCGLMTPFSTFELATLAAAPDGTCSAEFKTFPQYKAVAWLLPDHVLALALPRRTELGFRPDAELRRQLSSF